MRLVIICLCRGLKLCSAGDRTAAYCAVGVIRLMILSPSTIWSSNAVCSSSRYV